MSNPFNWKDEVETVWDSQATVWSERSVNMWDNGSRKDIVPFIEQRLQKDAKILDVGCGDGYGSYKLSQAGYDITGIDLSNEMINLAKGKLHNKEVSFLQGDIGDLPFEENSFDGIMSINVLEWTEVPSHALAELGRVLKKDGYLCVGILGPTAGPRAHSYPRVYGKKAIINTMMPWEFQRLAKEANFEYIDGFGVHKKEVQKHHYQDLPIDLNQALSFMWVFMLQKVGE